LPARYGRGLDELPDGLLDAFDATLVRSVEEAELRRALEENVAALVLEATYLEGAATKVAARLRPLSA
jgi:hypothetical protein